MNEIELIKRAEEYLTSRDIGFVPSGTIGRRRDFRVEVVFPVPESLDPNVAIVDPPDVRVWVSTDSENVELIHQM